MLADHRAAYLSYEGPVSGDRGEVVRVAAGFLDIMEDAVGRLILAGHIGGAAGTFTGTRRPGAGDLWRFVLSPANPGSH